MLVPWLCGVPMLHERAITVHALRLRTAGCGGVACHGVSSIFLVPNANMLPVQVVTLLCFVSWLVVHDTIGCASARTYMLYVACSPVRGQGLVCSHRIGVLAA